MRGEGGWRCLHLCPSIYVDHPVIRAGYARHDVREAQVIVERERRRDPEQLRVEQAQVAEAVEGRGPCDAPGPPSGPRPPGRLGPHRAPQHAAVVEGAQPEADAGRLASQEGSNRGMRYASTLPGTARVKPRSTVAGSKESSRRTMHWNWRTADRTGSTRATARGVSRMPSGARVSNSSPSSFLSRRGCCSWPTGRRSGGPPHG